MISAAHLGLRSARGLYSAKIRYSDFARRADRTDAPFVGEPRPHLRWNPRVVEVEKMSSIQGRPAVRTNAFLIFIVSAASIISSSPSLMPAQAMMRNHGCANSIVPHFHPSDRQAIRSKRFGKATSCAAEGLGIDRVA